MPSPIHRAAIARAHDLIAPYIRVTPVVEASGADFGLAAFPLAFKLEHLQHAGSFKTRGAFFNLLTRAIPAAGVVAASGGNHGAGGAYYQRLLQDFFVHHLLGLEAPDWNSMPAPGSTQAARAGGQ